MRFRCVFDLKFGISFRGYCQFVQNLHMEMNDVHIGKQMACFTFVCLFFFNAANSKQQTWTNRWNIANRNLLQLNNLVQISFAFQVNHIFPRKPEAESALRQSCKIDASIFLSNDRMNRTWKQCRRQPHETAKKKNTRLLFRTYTKQLTPYLIWKHVKSFVHCVSPSPLNI